jgi:hypothetical protein
MQLLTVVEAYFSSDQIRDDFFRAFGVYQEGGLSRFVFPDHFNAEKAIQLLRKNVVRYEVFFRFDLTSSELEDYPVVFLGLISLNAVSGATVNSLACEGYQLFSDYTTGIPYISDSARQLLEPLAHSTRFHATPSTDRHLWFQMRVGARLAGPIQIPGPREMLLCEDMPIRGDGRSIISRADADVIRTQGIALSDKFKVNETVRSWQPRMLCSGLVVSALTKAQIRGVLKPLAIALVEGSTWVADLWLYDFGAQ